MDSNQIKFVRILADLPNYSLIENQDCPSVLVPSKRDLTKLLSQFGDVEVDWKETADGYGYKIWALEKPDGFEPSDPEMVPVQVKAEAFDKLHQQALEYFHESVGPGYPHDDAPHYMFEAVMELTLAAMGDKKAMWKAMR